MLESEIRFVSKTVLRLHFPRHDDILDPDAKVAVLIVARLVRQYVAGRERHLAVLRARADPNGTLVDVEVRSDAVTGAVSVVEALLPEELARQGVQGEAGGAFGEDGGVESDDAFENQGVRLAFHFRRRAEVQGARRVGRTVEVLGAGIAEVDGLGVDDGAVARFGFVVDDGGVGACGGDGVEGEAGEVALGPDAFFIRRRHSFSIRSFTTYARIDSSLSAAWTSSSLVPFSTNSASSHAKYSLNAAPSRT